MEDPIVTYLKVQNGELPPRFVRASRIAASADDISWACHDRLLEQMKFAPFDLNSSQPPNFSLLDLKIELARRELSSCRLCPRECAADRMAGPAGFCGSGSEVVVHWEGILYGEEEELIPSHEVFVSGCSMRCAFCYSRENVVRPLNGSVLSPQEFGALANRRKREGALNLNIAGGDPMIHIYPILQSLKTISSTPIVWNTNMYASKSAMKLLDGIVDLYLGDIHFGCNECADDVASTPRYMETITETFLAARKSGAAVIVRHLALPGHRDCCLKPSLAWAKKYLPDVPFHLMPQYSPEGRAGKMPGIDRPLSQSEKDEGAALARMSGLRMYERKSDIEPRNMAFYNNINKIDHADAPVQIMIRQDGEIVISRLTGELTEVAQALVGKSLRAAECEQE
jgi:putative pyruvate formate lyase activating enzyme